MADFGTALQWAIVIAGIADFARPAEKLSFTQNFALTCTGLIWTRWCLIIKPRNVLYVKIPLPSICESMMPFWCLIAPVPIIRGFPANSVTHTASLPSTSSSPLSVSSRLPVSPSTTPPLRTAPLPWLRRSSRKSRRVSRLPRMPSRLREAEHPGKLKKKN